MSDTAIAIDFFAAVAEARAAIVATDDGEALLREVAADFLEGAKEPDLSDGVRAAVLSTLDDQALVIKMIRLYADVSKADGHPADLSPDGLIFLGIAAMEATPAIRQHFEQEVVDA